MLNGCRMPDGAMAWEGAASDIACSTASIAAYTATKRPPHGYGDWALTREPGGSRTDRGRRLPSFIGIVGSRKQRTAKTAPASAWETEELTAAGTCGSVPSKSSTA